jgi:predicted dinucleotide-binding enzyme
VVKALHLFAGQMWLDDPDTPRTVAVCGDDPDALALTSRLIIDLGGQTAVVGGLSAARQLEEAAGFVMRLVAAGYNPRTAVPDVTPAR